MSIIISTANIDKLVNVFTSINVDEAEFKLRNGLNDPTGVVNGTSYCSVSYNNIVFNVKLALESGGYSSVVLESACGVDGEYNVPIDKTFNRDQVIGTNAVHVINWIVDTAYRRQNLDTNEKKALSILKHICPDPVGSFSNYCCALYNRAIYILESKEINKRMHITSIDHDFVEFRVEYEYDKGKHMYIDMTFDEGFDELFIQCMGISHGLGYFDIGPIIIPADTIPDMKTLLGNMRCAYNNDNKAKALLGMLDAKDKFYKLQEFMKGRDAEGTVSILDLHDVVASYESILMINRHDEYIQFHSNGIMLELTPTSFAYDLILPYKGSNDQDAVTLKNLASGLTYVFEFKKA